MADKVIQAVPSRQSPGAGQGGNHTAGNVRKAEEAFDRWQQQHQERAESQTTQQDKDGTNERRN